jgi:hypothetical protein
MPAHSSPTTKKTKKHPEQEKHAGNGVLARGLRGSSHATQDSIPSMVSMQMMGYSNHEPWARREIAIISAAAQRGPEGGSPLILGGDIAAPNVTWQSSREEGAALQPVFQRRYATRDFTTFEDLITHFLRQSGTGSQDRRPADNRSGFWCGRGGG